MSYLQKYVPKETKDLNLKAFNMTTNYYEAKEMIELVVCKYKFNTATCNSNQKWNNEACQFECKKYHKSEKDYSWNPSTCICENSHYLKSFADTSLTECDEIITFMDNVSTKKTNTIGKNVTSTASINFHSKNVRDCCILHTFLLVIILLLVITIICYHYAK